MRNQALRSTSLITTARGIAMGIALLFTGCSGTFKSSVNFNPTQPIRIAVLPFVQVDENGEFAQVDENLLIDDVSLVSSKLKETPAKFVQNLVQSELSKATLDVLTPAVVEADLLHRGFDKEGVQPVQIDFKKVFEAPPATLCKDVLTCDAVLYGRVTKWDRSYYGIQANATVALDLKLVSAKDGKILFESSADDSEGRGLSKGPTGYGSLVLEPLKGLDNGIITDLAREVVQKAVKPIFVKNRPEFLTSPPPAIIAAAHNSQSGVITKTEKLTVVALGSPGSSASFSIGSAIQGVPMVERGTGHYLGEYYPLATDVFDSQKVAVSLRDQFGRVTVQKLGKVAVTLK
jgi:hypothetical protein